MYLKTQIEKFFFFLVFVRVGGYMDLMPLIKNGMKSAQTWNKNKHMNIQEHCMYFSSDYFWNVIFFFP